MMTVVYIAAGIIGCIGILTAFIVAGHVLSTLKTLIPEEHDWPHDGVDYLWWDEGI